MKGHGGGVSGRWARRFMPIAGLLLLTLVGAGGAWAGDGGLAAAGVAARPGPAGKAITQGQSRQALLDRFRRAGFAQAQRVDHALPAVRQAPKLADPGQRPPPVEVSLFGVPGGCNGPIYSIVVAPSGLVYLGGEFSVCAQTEAAQVVAYEPRTQQFLPLGVDAANGVSGGASSGVSGGVYALALDGETLVAAGSFNQAGGIEAFNLARWDGRGWSSIGSGPNNGVQGVVFDVEVVAGSVYVGGIFSTAGDQPANHIARWDGSAWFTYAGGLSSPGNVYVNALLVEGEEVHAGGFFTQAGTVAANNIARWNGSSWSALGSGPANGVDNVVISLARYQGELIVGGVFGRAGSLAVNNIARWNGSSWGLLGSAEANGLGAALTMLVSAGQLFVAGNFGVAGDVEANHIARWNGSRWFSLGEVEANGVNNTIYALGGSAQALYAGGVFDLAGGQSANAAALWNGSVWSALERSEGTGLNNQVHALAVVGGELQVGGSFTRAGDQIANRIASWNGSRWAALGEGEGEANGVNVGVLALASYGGELYVGGAMSAAGGQPANRIARWNGSRWADVAGGVDGNFPLVRVLASIDGQLYVGGEFLTAGGVPANKIARWNGQQWSSLGSGAANGVSSEDFIAVHAIVQHAGAIFVGGSFTEAGGQSANAIARWDGNAWSALGTGEANGANNVIYALASFQGALHVGGGFSSAGGAEVFGIARWNGSAFEPLGGGIPGVVLAMVVAGDELYVGGSFSEVDGRPANGLARWNGQRWEGLATDAPPQIVRALAADGTSLYAGGAGLSQTPLPELQSRGLDGGAANGASERPMLSRDGRWLVFASAADNLLVGDDNPGSDIYLRDTRSGQLTRVSDVAVPAKGGGMENFSAPAISASGGSVAFSGSSGQIFGRFGGLGRTVSRNAAGEAGNGPSANVQLPGEGRIAVFESQASNLLPGPDGNGSVSDIFAVDMTTGAVSLISASASGAAADGPSHSPWASADGQSVAFISRAGNLVETPVEQAAAKRGGVAQAVLVGTGGLGRTGIYLSRNPVTGALGNGDSRNVRLTPDARFGVFESDASNLVEGDDNGVTDIFWFELANGQLLRLQRVSTSRYGLQGNGASREPSISDDGQYISFQTDADNLIELDRNQRTDVLIKWLVTGELLRLSRTTDGQQPNGDSANPALSGDASLVVFGSLASNLANNDNNDLRDVFAARLRQASGPAIVAGARNYSYTWWNPNQPGWGYNLQHQGDLLYGTWYTYAEDGEVMFLTVEGAAQSDGSFAGPVYRVAGTPFQLINGSSAITAVNAVGQASMRFDGPAQLSLEYTVSGVSQTRALVPFSFVEDPPACFSTLDSRASASNYSDLWWNPAEPGWGLTLAHQGNVIFVLWYTYGEGGRDQWLSATLSLQPDGSYRGPMARPDSGVPLAQIMGPATSFPVPEVGSVELRFNDGQSGSFSYSVDGVTQSKPITRFVVVAADQFKPVCLD